MTAIPFQVALTMNNAAGELFGNRHLGVSVQRWTDLESFGEAVTLVDCMFEEMAFTGGQTIIVDLAALDPAAESEIYQLALILFCITGANTKRVALAGISAQLREHPGLAKLARRAEGLGVTFVYSEDFAGAVALLNESAATVNGTILPQATPSGAASTYGGTVSHWPTHTTVALTLSGNDGDLEAVERALQTAIQAVQENNAKVLLIDTTACSPVGDAERLRFVLETALPPLMALDLAYFLHVRPRGEEFILVPGAPDISSLFKASGISYERLHNTAEALVRLDKLAGHVPAATNTSSTLH